MPNIRKNRWSPRGWLKNSDRELDQHPQVRRENAKSDEELSLLKEMDEAEEVLRELED